MIHIGTLGKFHLHRYNGHFTIRISLIFKAPLKLYGGGNFALTAVKEIDVTEDYLKMSKDVTKCQDRITLEECETKQFFEHVVDKIQSIQIRSILKSKNIQMYILLYIIEGTPL